MRPKRPTWWEETLADISTDIRELSESKKWESLTTEQQLKFINTLQELDKIKQRIHNIREEVKIMLISINDV